MARKLEVGVKITADTKSAKKGLDDLDKAVDRTDKSFKSLGDESIELARSLDRVEDKVGRATTELIELEGTALTGTESLDKFERAAEQAADAVEELGEESDKAKGKGKGLKDATDDNRTAFDKLKGALGTLRKNYIALTVVIASVVAAFTKVIAIAADHEAAVRSLDVALGNLEGGNQRLVTSLKEHATVLAATAVQTDEDVLRATARIALFFKEEDQIKAITKASLNLSAALGGSVAERAGQLTRAIITSENALREQGLVIEGVAGSAERFNSAITATNILQGQAAAAATTTTGRFGILRSEFENLIQATIGAGTETKTFGELLDGIIGRLQLATRTAEGLDDAIVVLAKSQDVESISIKNLVKGYLALISPINRVIISVTELTKENGLLSKAVDFLNNKFGAQADAIRTVETAASKAERELRAYLKVQKDITAASDAAVAADIAFADSFRELGAVLESETDVAIQKHLDFLDEVRRRNQANLVSNEALAAAEILTARAIAELNGELETQNGVFSESTERTDFYSTSIGRAASEVGLLSAAEERNASVVEISSARRIAARAAERNARGGSRNFITGDESFVADIGGGTFSINQQAVDRGNGRVDFVTVV